MRRAKQFGWNLASSYVTLGANVLFTLVSLPLALHHLGKELFGLWTIIVQATMLLGLFDTGFSGSMMRILISYKDRKENGGDYAQIFQISAILIATVSLLIIGVGLISGSWVADFANVPESQQTCFKQVYTTYVIVFALSYASGIFRISLHAHQRLDVIHWSQALQILVSIPIMVYSFEKGFGLWSLVIVNGFWTLYQWVWCVFCSAKLRTFRISHLLSKPRWSRTGEVVSFAKDRLFAQIGFLIVRSVPVVLVSRYLGLEAAATWNVGTRLTFLLELMLEKISLSALPPLAEMHVRGEKEKLQSQLARIISMVALLGGFMGGGIYALNSSFVSIWTNNAVQWSSELDLLLAAMLFLVAVGRSFRISFNVGMDFKIARWVYLLEGFCVVGGGAYVLRVSQELFSILLVLIFSKAAFSWPFGMHESQKYLGPRVKSVWLSLLDGVLVLFSVVGIFCLLDDIWRGMPLVWEEIGKAALCAVLFVAISIALVILKRPGVALLQERLHIFAQRLRS